jgi:hypothetical protein
MEEGKFARHADDDVIQTGFERDDEEGTVDAVDFEIGFRDGTFRVVNFTHGCFVNRHAAGDDGSRGVDAFGVSCDAFDKGPRKHEGGGDDDDFCGASEKLEAREMLGRVGAEEDGSQRGVATDVLRDEDGAEGDDPFLFLSGDRGGDIAAGFKVSLEEGDARFVVFDVEVTVDLFVCVVDVGGVKDVVVTDDEDITGVVE